MSEEEIWDFANAYTEAERFRDNGFSDESIAPIATEFLESRLLHEISLTEMSEDEDIAEEQLRAIVSNLQITAFLAGVFWREELENKQFNVNTGEELSIELSSEQKIELARSLLNEDGISLKIL